MTTGEIIIAVLTSSAFTGLLVEIVRTIRRGIDKRQNKGLAKIENDLTDVKHTLDETGKSLSKMEEELVRQKETDLVLLHDRIWEIFDRLRNEEHISVEDKANLEYLYDEYKNSNGNHHAAIMFELIESKPLKRED